jgi:hypothetical protein
MALTIIALALKVVFFVIANVWDPRDNWGCLAQWYQVNTNVACLMLKANLIPFDCLMEDFWMNTCDKSKKSSLSLLALDKHLLRRYYGKI